MDDVAQSSSLTVIVFTLSYERYVAVLHLRALRSWRGSRRAIGNDHGVLRDGVVIGLQRCVKIIFLLLSLTSLASLLCLYICDGKSCFSVTVHADGMSPSTRGHFSGSERNGKSASCYAGREEKKHTKPTVQFADFSVHSLLTCIAHHLIHVMICVGLAGIQHLL